MRVKRFLSYKIVYLPCGKVLGLSVLSREFPQITGEVWESVEKFHANVSLESQRRREDWSQCEFHNMPIIVARHKPSRKFWVKEEIAALRAENKLLKYHEYSEEGYHIKGATIEELNQMLEDGGWGYQLHRAE